ncbi:phage capsid protein [Akkermansia sp. JRP_AM1]|uniref:phage capsid protein n=1 Tax=Akkermansia sp. JRP_AM1 TaxID=3414159 RepID=UPI003BFA66B2
MAISPKQHMDMVLMEQTQNRNYGFSSLTNGEVNEFLKVKFLVTNMLPIDEQGNRLCCAWLRSRVKFGCGGTRSSAWRPVPNTWTCANRSP